MHFKAILLDLDGTVYRGKKLIPGAAAFVARLRRVHLPLLFITNNSTRTPEQVASHLHAIGLPASPEEILTSAQATAAFIGSGRVFCIGEIGLVQALQQQGIALAENRVMYVVVGLDRQISYKKIEKAARLIRAGARFIGCNPDRFFPNEDGISPGNGAIIAAIAAACDQKPHIIGKPERPIIDIALRRLQVAPEHAVLIGDNLETDIPAGAHAGVATILLTTGVSRQEDLPQAKTQPTWIARDYDEVCRRIFPS